MYFIIWQQESCKGVFMKKIFIMLLLVMLVTSGIFAQDQTSTLDNWISGEVSLLGIGISYERMLLPNLSIGVNAYANTMNFFSASGFTLNGRYYPFGNPFFVELGLGYGSNGGTNNEVTYIHKEYPDSSGGTTVVKTSGFVIAPGLGAKFDVGQPGGFFLQPGIRFPIAIGNQKPWENWLFGYYDDNYDFKKQNGVALSYIIYLGMGYAF